jgi:hypothetical protein
MYASAIAHQNNVHFQEYLLKLDNDLAAQVRTRGCPDCQGVLHAAPFWRKPRGARVRRRCRIRLSFCCARQGCRHRATPPSLRFLGPKVYLGAVVVLITAMRCGVTPVRMRTLKDLVGVSRQTVLRWQAWWQQELPATPLWRARKGSLSSQPQLRELPQSLLEEFTCSCVHERVLALLRFLAPLTGGRRSAVPL